MEKFKVGDIVEYYKKPTKKDWEAVGEIYIPFEIGAILEVTDICPMSGALCTDKGGFFPKECFRLVEKREPEFIFGI
jgi:hypothetical protein